jgi:CheY-like chemotaxis protein
MCHVFVVDDSEDIREMLRDFLEEEGYSVSTAENGQDALTQLDRAERPCLIFVDLLMPVMDGVELIHKLRERPDLASIPVVVVSAASTVEPPAGTPILRKPVGPSTILDAVRRACAH